MGARQYCDWASLSWVDEWAMNVSEKNVDFVGVVVRWWWLAVALDVVVAVV